VVFITDLVHVLVQTSVLVRELNRCSAASDILPERAVM